MVVTELPAYSRGSVAPLCGASGSLTDGRGRKLATCHAWELRASSLLGSVHRNHQERFVQHQLAPASPGAPSGRAGQPGWLYEEFRLRSAPEYSGEQETVYSRGPSVALLAGASTDVHIRLTLKILCQRVVAHAGKGPFCTYGGGRDGYSAGRGERAPLGVMFNTGLAL